MQKQGHLVLEKKLQQIFGDDYTVIQATTKSLAIHSDDFKNKMKLKYLDEELTRKLIQDWDQYKDVLKFENLSLEE